MNKMVELYDPIFNAKRKVETAAVVLSNNQQHVLVGSFDNENPIPAIMDFSNRICVPETK